MQTLVPLYYARTLPTEQSSQSSTLLLTPRLVNIKIPKQLSGTLALTKWVQPLTINCLSQGYYCYNETPLPKYLGEVRVYVTYASISWSSSKKVRRGTQVGRNQETGAGTEAMH